MSADLRARREAWAAEQTCVYCGTPAPRVEWRLRVKPLGTYSVAGAQTKVVAEEWPWLVCGGCGHASEGKR